MLIVTGITGLTGRFLLKALRAEGYRGKIRCLVRETSDVSWIKDANIELKVGNVENYDSLFAAIQEVKAVIHLVNIRSSPQIIKACHDAGIKRVVFINTTGIFSKYQQYAEEYQRLESYMLSCGLDYTIIRPTMIYGNHQDKNIHKLIKIVNRYPIIPILGNGYGLMQPIYAGDLATVIARTLMKDISIAKAYNVAGRDPVRFDDIMRMISKILNKKRLFIKAPYTLAIVASYMGELIPNNFINIERVQRLQEDKVFSYEKAVRDLDFSPISFEKGLKLEIEELKELKIIV